jgi:hypothetical protein
MARKRAAGGRFGRVSTASSQIVEDAAKLLDEELAAGIVAARKVQERFRKERRIDPADFSEALQRFQSDAHEVVNVLNDQLERLRSKENAELITRFLGHAHDLLDLAVGVVTMSGELVNELAQANRPKRNARRRSGRQR